MQTAQELYNIRLNRIKTAIELGKPDRTPIAAWFDVFAAAYKGVKMSKFSTNLFFASKTIISALKDFPEFDAIEGPVTPLKLMGIAFLSRVKLAGKELPEGSLYQIDERERLSHEDYDEILKIGWKKFNKKYIKNRLNYSTGEIIYSIIGLINGSSKLKKAGMPMLTNVFFVPPLESIAAGRSISKFMADLFRMPDKVEAVLDEMLPHYINDLKTTIKKTKPLTVFFGISRGSSEFISPKLFNRFTWPIVLKISQAIIESGSYVNLHFDSNWDREIERFKELPKGKCIWACDHATDIFKLKKALDGHMCIKGDVPAALLSIGTPDEVYNYCAKLIKEIGPEGFILAPGCTLPMNAKTENVKAMISAATEK